MVAGSPAQSKDNRGRLYVNALKHRIGKTWKILKMVTIKKLTVVILVLVLVLAYLLIRENQTEILVVVEQTELLPKPERKDDKENKPISVLEKGTIGLIVHIRYSKEFMFYKIRLENGLEGYVMFDPPLIKTIDFRK